MIDLRAQAQNCLSFFFSPSIGAFFLFYAKMLCKTRSLNPNWKQRTNRLVRCAQGNFLFSLKTMSAFSNYESILSEPFDLFWASNLYRNERLRYSFLFIADVPSTLQAFIFEETIAFRERSFHKCCWVANDWFWLCRSVHLNV